MQGHLGQLMALVAVIDGYLIQLLVWHRLFFSLLWIISCLCAMRNGVMGRFRLHVHTYAHVAVSQFRV